MIPFLIVTAIVNVALGYALAVYLGRANAPTTWRKLFATTPASAIEATRFAEPTFAEQYALLPNDQSRPTDNGSSFAPAARKPVAEAAVDAIRSSFTTHPADDEPFAHAEVMEQELLAGIEEFRNQLAQLKGQGVAGILLDTAALEAAR